MNAQMKTVIDRTVARYTVMSDNEVYFTMDGFKGFTSCLSGTKERGVTCGTGAWKMGEIKGCKAMNQA